jgi:hypothetical protein
MIYSVLPKVNYGRKLDDPIPNAPSFTFGEFVQSVTAVELNIANVPTEAEWKNIENFAVFIAQPLRNKCGRIKISSGFRCKALNSHPKIGSSDRSFHVTGGAADLEPLDCSLMELLEEAYKLNFSEIIAEFFPTGWVHVGFLKGDDRRRLKLKDPTHHYAIVTIDQLREIYG